MAYWFFSSPEVINNLFISFAWSSAALAYWRAPGQGAPNFCLWARVTLLDYHYLRTQTLGSHSARALTLDSQVHRDTFKLVMVTMCLCSMYVLYTYYYIWRRWSWWQIISSSFSLILPASFPYYQTPVFSYIHTNLSMYYCLLCAISWSVTDMSTWACN